jgi:hypothetical protein
MADAAATADPGPFGRIVPVPEGVVVEDGASFVASAGEMLKQESAGLGFPSLEVHTIDEFLALAQGQWQLTREDKTGIVQQALLLFENLYPHLPFKKRIYEFAHPVESLSSIRDELQQRDIPDFEFHYRMTCACSLVVDAHTIYGLPEPYHGSIAFLPFQLRSYRDQDKFPRFVITRVMKIEGEPHSFFAPGAEVTHWDGNTADFYVLNSHGRLPGGNYRARLTRGSVFATIRPLTYCEIPEPAAATLHYIPQGSSETHAIRLPWSIATGLGDRTTFPAASFSLSDSVRMTSQADRVMVHREEVTEQRTAEGHLGLGLFAVQPGAANTPAVDIDLQQSSQLPSVFEFQCTDGVRRTGALDPQVLRDPGQSEARFGYIRIRNFGGTSAGANAMVNEFHRILSDVMNARAPGGLVLDIRGNPGGDVQAAERMLQMLTPRRIVPASFHLANTPAVQAVLRRLAKQSINPEALAPAEEVVFRDALAELKPWIDDVEVSAASGDLLTSGHPLTPEADVNAIGQIYHGPCILIIDSLSYSAADIFAAGFQDHAIGLILGVDTNTGGGGANVWTHDYLLGRVPSSQALGLKPLPDGVTLSLAIRRCSRVGLRTGLAVEDTGVIADIQYDPSSVADVLDGFTRAVGLACRIMGARRDFQIVVRQGCVLRDGAVYMDLELENIDFLVFYIDGVKVGEGKVDPGDMISPTVPVPPGDPRPGEITIEGYAQLPDGSGSTGLVLVATNGPQFISDSA